MDLNLDTTKLMANRPPKALNNLEVTDLDPLGAGSTTWPRAIEVQTPHADGAKLLAMWTGFPALSVGDFVVCWRDSTDTSLLRVAGSGGNTSQQIKVSELWESDGGAVAAQTDASGNVTVNGTRTLTSGGEVYIKSDAGVWQRQHDFATTIIDDFVNGYDAAQWAGWQTDSGFATPTSSSNVTSLMRPWFNGGNAPAGFLKYTWTVPGTPGSTAFPFRAVKFGFNVQNDGTYFGLYMDDYNGSTISNSIKLVYRYDGTNKRFDIVSYNNATPTTLKTLEWLGPITLNWQTFSSAWSSWGVTFYAAQLSAGLIALGSVSGLTWTPTRTGLIFFVNQNPATSANVANVDWVAKV